MGLVFPTRKVCCIAIAVYEDDVLSRTSVNRVCRFKPGYFTVSGPVVHTVTEQLVDTLTHGLPICGLVMS